ncbi:prepilin-type N-terminal cleavage/methylation domain-containing protein [Alteromonas aestuariivivens]|uniref:Prepilin-type N-terminal cleavage/methylation domain-containing protein n=1 Tax=Alteromonas aestuariivivens TaxID=1938339 RepID=A0A3D8MEZ0_9ALTE|nr:prepilin-type N-terminal cleavage/methylation domain-containing protein [Alteromonas aestuariivivens]RDV29322.1 prepilin-type N-terminal cleavage/methylation domain-containing protein [Alteromonas aestuariivivens]
MQKSRGFTLIEVLIAALIVMLGVTGFVTLQGEFMRSDAALNLRAVAIQLAEEKLDDLRRFDVLEVTAGELAYNDIDDNLGGTLPAGDLTVAVGTDNGRTHQFTRNWTILDKYFVDTDNDGDADTWLDEGDAGLPLNIPTVSSQKQVAVTIQWTDLEGEVKSVTVEGSLAPVPASRSFQAVNETDGAKTTPKVAYTPGEAPDVISYELGNGESIETSKPVPEIDNQGDNNIVQFETIRYIDLPGQTDKLEQEDFLTVNCSCKLGGWGKAKTPHMTVLKDGELTVEPGKEVTKAYGVVADNQQPAQCTACCRDHHDTSTMISEEQYFRDENGSPHQHYKRQADGSFVDADYVGDPYDEVCRFKRVDGYFEIYPDWQLIDIIQFSDKYLLSETTLNNYRTYTEAVISAAVQGNSLPAKPTDRNITVTPGGYQLISRGIYLDRMKSSHLTELRSMISSGEADWKAAAPFYDVNLTLLTEWDSDTQTVATVTNEDIQTILDPSNDFYGTYSRGRVEAITDGTSTVTVGGMAYNGSITGTGAISQKEVDNAVFDDSMLVTVDSKSASEKFYALIGNINCLITIDGITEACETNNDKRSTYVDLTLITITNTPSQFSCPITIPKGKSTPFFSCSNVSENWAGSVNFALSVPGYTTTISIRYPDGSVVETDKLVLGEGLSDTSNQDYSIVVELVR